MVLSIFTYSPLRYLSCRAGWVGVVLVSIMVFAGSAFGASPRTALVVGNQRYEEKVGSLRNTNNDAKAIAQTLRTLGFSVIERHDITRDQLLKAVEEFRKTLPGSEVALFYYAGHGISVSGANYLVPLKSGFDPADADAITLRMMAETRLFNAEQAVADMSAAGPACNIVILDACRNTPLTRDGRSRGFAGRAGLSEMTPPAGSLIAFATDAGRTAFDGDGINGLYTEELLKNLRTPGLTIEQVFKRTRAGVLHRSDGTQVPAEYSRLIGDDIYLAGAAVPVATPLAIEPPAASLASNNGPDTLPTAADLKKFATAGEVAECLSALRKIASEKGRGDYAYEPIEILLEQVKESLRGADKPSQKITASAETCESILSILPDCLPLDQPRTSEIAAQAYNRRGDALLILGRTEEALRAFDTAQPLAPEDAYILYNRGMAYLKLGNQEAARADFTAASDSKLKQPGARRLAQQALAELK